MYKLKSLSMSNFKNFDEVTVSFDENLSYLVGGNGANKSTLIDALWVTFQGVGDRALSKNNFPVIANRFMIIGNKKPSAKTGAVIRDMQTGKDIVINRKITKEGTKLTFEAEEGVVLDQRFLDELFSIFLISPKKFLQLTPKQQAISLGIDLAEYDAKLKTLKEEFTSIGHSIKAIGVLESVPPTKAVDVSALVKEKGVRTEFNDLQKKNQEAITNVINALDNLKVDKIVKDKVAEDWTRLWNLLDRNVSEIRTREVLEYYASIDAFLKGKNKSSWEDVEKLNEQIARGEEYLPKIPKAEPLQDIAELDQQIADASSINVKASQYAQYLEKRDRKEQLEASKEKNQEDQAEVNKQRTEKIQSLELPFAELSINEDGELLLMDRYLKDEYFSTGELIRTIPMLIISSMKRKGEIQFPFVFISDFSLVDEENQKSLITWFAENNLQVVLEVVSTKPLGKSNEIFLKDGVIHTEE